MMAALASVACLGSKSTVRLRLIRLLRRLMPLGDLSIFTSVTEDTGTDDHLESELGNWKVHSNARDRLPQNECERVFLALHSGSAEESDLAVHCPPHQPQTEDSLMDSLRSRSTTNASSFTCSVASNSNHPRQCLDRGFPDPRLPDRVWQHHLPPGGRRGPRLAGSLFGFAFSLDPYFTPGPFGQDLS